MQIGQQETWIRERAYALWEQEGRPAGREHQHWFQAAYEAVGATAETLGKGKTAGKAASTKVRATKQRKAA